MSVLKKDRGISSMEFYKVAIDLRRYLTIIALKDFGVKRRVSTNKYFFFHESMSADEKELMKELLTKCDKTCVFKQDFDEWFSQSEREYICDLSRKLVQAICMANSIYITNLHDADQRRSYQNEALGHCHAILEEIQFILKIFEHKEISNDVLLKMINMTHREINLILRWRKSDNKVRNKIKNELKDEYKEFININKNANTLFENVSDDLKCQISHMNAIITQDDNGFTDQNLKELQTQDI